MGDNKVIDFTYHLDLKRKKLAFSEHILESGWEIDADVTAAGSDVCVYLMDSEEKAILTFGCAKESFPAPYDREVIHWGHFAQSWETIVNPDMGTDAKSREITMQMARWALPSLNHWYEFSDKAFNVLPGQTAHIIVIVDKDDYEEPVTLIVAHSYAPIMNVESIQTIYKSYMKEQ